ncbi:MAG: hypothetical protein HOP19_17180 [Acidobacteria bacterium]|nr:hypothetical protein [Acidobacteriota bacterium]
MSTNTAEKVFKLIEELPSLERVKLDELLAQPIIETVKKKEPPAKITRCEPLPDRSREHAWVKEHKDDYAGQWVALDGNHLVAASFTAMEVVKVIDTKSPNPPLLIRVPSPGDLPYVGI